MVQEKIRVNILTHKVISHEGIESTLRSKEYQILSLLLKQAPQYVTRKEIISQVWSGTYSADATINQTIKSIRRKLGDNDFTLIKTVPRVGYQIEHPEFFILEELNLDLDMEKVKFSEKDIVEDSVGEEKESTVLMVNNDITQNDKTPVLHNGNFRKYRRNFLISFVFVALFFLGILFHIWWSFFFHPKKKLEFGYGVPTVTNLPLYKGKLVKDMRDSIHLDNLICYYSVGDNKHLSLICLSQDISESLK